MWIPRIRVDSAVPIYEQVVESTAFAIASKQLQEGDTLPSVRALASELRVNPNTAARAARELERLGLATGTPGVGTVVAKGALAPARRIAREALQREIDTTVGVAAALGLDLDELLDSVRRRWKEAPRAARG
jgi:GntR family transcriptional regulator